MHANMGLNDALGEVTGGLQKALDLRAGNELFAKGLGTRQHPPEQKPADGFSADIQGRRRFLHRQGQGNDYGLAGLNGRRGFESIYGVHNGIVLCAVFGASSLFSQFGDLPIGGTLGSMGGILGRFLGKLGTQRK